ncbi:geranylgeranyl transferase type-2 subunit alpha [Cryptococcus neoformans C23]|uniref:Geranylgeranyl transferase type-2 subunit alpha n=1 Tax=Cryptococcus neoformans (strain H99 / ATCC 208821 / CBS 10515 / FGSC 9487) TaxID=235443 RepID=J9VVW3_CRYN9|nr:geranylgeranyl transferase type-2 subunit alpha [Cryptococcus neoformans var. grubii H99]AUB28780.1 geranylgeranyl transferase type-2 subunit alpha [Cryptococcus neoformans var. grubii]OWZ26934.1 geranylgeranyl transferase type-2 subunit alpha [Cryptococcus neoformans var. grubii AD2-60a]OWZ27976.1 geranylgeranyl transferase type-2 subunit alpha [Cryptococcus neoformans var. grubii AD1-83a]OWZ38795.1 geranylgeranyl transferase type-2 subunit alpha [Cryptococcus neoformans var. grubii C23]OW|eukprot:XP_012053309.1 geranylgeranyl transferase type-2 subunit alpha [Cryptococcus neoformans var. grubii H99]
MHGIKRSRLTPQAAEAKRLKEQSKIEVYLALEKDVLTRKSAKEYSEEALGKTTQLLDLNPEFYTIWNYRRDILLYLFPALAAEEVVGHLTTDLRLTTAYLLVHPKVYWIWNHRKWCLESVPTGPEESHEWKARFWDGELKLVEKMLDADPRNFHAWGYRRYVLSSMPVQRPLTEELKYTQSKIESNFSNFSAWHYRTKTLAAIWEENNASPEDIKKVKDKEFELVTQALWTDPGDQSGWLYHSWLVGQKPPLETLQRELKNIQELYDMEPDSKWCINALAQYTLLLAKQPSTALEEADKLRKDAKKLYEVLIEVDADRKERYRDMAASCA